MAYIDITSTLCNNQSWSSNGYGLYKTNVGSYGFVSSAITDNSYPAGIQNTTSLSSNNAGIASSVALCYLHCTPASSRGMKIKISYVSEAESTYDYALFGKSGATFTTATTNSSSDVYESTYGSQSMDLREVNYFVTAATNIYILYRKDTSVDRGIDRLVFRVSVEKQDSGGYSDWVWGGCAIKLYGYRYIVSNSYSLAAYRQNTIMEFTNQQGVMDAIDGSGCTLYDSTIAIYWISGSTNNLSSLIPYTDGETLEQYAEFSPPGHTSEEEMVPWLFVTGTSVQNRPDPTTVFQENGYSVASLAEEIYCDQRCFTVCVRTNSDLNKAYYSVYFPSPINASFQTGKDGYVRLLTSACTWDKTIQVTITRNGSSTITQNVTEWQPVTVNPQASDYRIATHSDMKLFNSELATNAGYTDTTKCVTYDSSMFDTANGATNRLMWLNNFLYFTATPAYFKDDTQGGGSTPPTPSTGYGVEANVMSMSWTNSGPSNLVVQSIIIYAGVGDINNDDVLYNLLQPKTLTAGSSGSFTIPVVNDYVEDVTYLTVQITCANYASITISLNTQSHGAIYFDFATASGTQTKQREVTSDLTITGGSLSCTYATG